MLCIYNIVFLNLPSVAYKTYIVIILTFCCYKVIYKCYRKVYILAIKYTLLGTITIVIETYNKLRGYFSDDPCKNIPKGHDPELWKKHHDCP